MYSFQDLEVSFKYAKRKIADNVFQLKLQMTIHSNLYLSSFQSCAKSTASPAVAKVHVVLAQWGAYVIRGKSLGNTVIAKMKTILQVLFNVISSYGLLQCLLCR